MQSVIILIVFFHQTRVYKSHHRLVDSQDANFWYDVMLVFYYSTTQEFLLDAVKLHGDWCLSVTYFRLAMFHIIPSDETLSNVGLESNIPGIYSV